MTKSVLSVGALTSEVTDRLRAGGRANHAAREARRLVAAIAEISAETFLGCPEQPVSDEIAARVRHASMQRAKGMPLGRIVGHRDFYGRSFELGTDTLEPRDDSEILIDAVLEIVREAQMVQPTDRSDAPPLRILDVGTGSGCLLITLLAELPGSVGVGSDIAPGALAIAQRNATRLGVMTRADFILSDGLAEIEGPFDFLISNPPYIRRNELAGLDLDVRDYDPPLALDGGLDGLEVYRKIGKDIARCMPNGWVVFEIGAGMKEAVCLEIDRLVGDVRVTDWRVWRDFNGHERCVAFKTRNKR